MRKFRNMGEAVGAINRARVRIWFRDHLCGTQRECSEALMLSVMAVNRHVKEIRSEWRTDKMESGFEFREPSK